MKTLTLNSVELSSCCHAQFVQLVSHQCLQALALVINDQEMKQSQIDGLLVRMTLLM